MKDLIEKIKEDEELKKIPKKKIALIVAQTLEAIRQEVDEADQTVRVPKLGRFIIRKGSETKGDKETAVRRIRFSPAVKKS